MEVIRKKADNKLKLMSPGRDKVLLSNPIQLYEYFFYVFFFLRDKEKLLTYYLHNAARFCLPSWSLRHFLVCLYVCMVLVFGCVLCLCVYVCAWLYVPCIFVWMLVCISMSLFVCLCMFVCVLSLFVCVSVSVFVSAWLCLCSILVWVTVRFYCLSIFVCLLFYMIMSVFVFLSVCVFVCKHSTYVRRKGLHVHIECHSVILLSTR